MQVRSVIASWMRRGVSVPFSGHAPATVGRPDLDHLPDDELERLNELLPWAAFIADSRGRRFGNAYSSSKRVEAQSLPDPRLVAFAEAHPLVGRTVVEVGCFEGIHTTALCDLGSTVIAVDARIENVVKTAVRCLLLGHRPDVRRVDLEVETDGELPDEWDVLVHIGVLYHLTDPAAHLMRFAARTTGALLLDTHVAPESSDLLRYESAGREWQYHRIYEAGRVAPFAGTRDHAKWLREDDLLLILNGAGFEVEVVERRDERNGPRVLVHAARRDD